MRYNRGESAGEAFENSFGMTPDDMDLALRNYTKQRRMTVLTVEVTDYEGEITQATLSPGEQNFLLADIAWRVGKEDVALDYLEDINTEDRDFARSLSLAAVLENHQDRVEKASAYAEQALTLAPQDSQVLTNYAHWILDARLRQEKEQADVSALVDKQIAYGGQAIAIDPTNLEALRYLWIGQIAGGDDVEALKTMMAAYQQEPSSVAINFVIANHLMALQRSDLAKPFFERVMNWSHSQEQRQQIQQLLARIEKEKSAEDTDAPVN